MGRVKTTGYGWTGSVLPLLGLVGGAPLGIAVGTALGAEDVLMPPAAGVLVAELLAATAMFLVGLAKNSTRTSQGRVWTNTHKYGRYGVQWSGVTLALACAALPFAVTVEKLTRRGLIWAGLVVAVAATAGISRLIYVKTCAVATDA
ncbi:hypothetical protein [Actinomadura opuntiae]|uniref:hypothetical protein n=1 Tax=Actinomadura sp. OS1-43 TaxID=604315 RepID=UPI00255ACEBD|nr:hypothetical protein [Actinomadura sp. OS1-43]MDL4814809.1 hypothetical protein [Actinomadura sp. OS1-43]